MASNTHKHDQATNSLPRCGNQKDMVKETLMFDDTEIQVNLCYQITDNTQVGQRRVGCAKQNVSNAKEHNVIQTGDLQTYANPCYQYYTNHNSNENGKQRNDMYLLTEESTRSPFQHQAEADDGSILNDEVENKDNIRCCLYIMLTLTVVLLLSTMVATVLSVLTYNQLPKRMHKETQFSRPLTRIKNDTSLQITEIQEGISQAKIKCNSTKNAIMTLQIKLDEVKLNASQLFLQVEEVSRHILNTSATKLNEGSTTRTQETQAESLRVQLHCGAGEWHRVAHLNMSNPTETCPPAWVEYTSDGIRACRRPNSPGGSCPGTVYPINDHMYSKVCGSVIGYQLGSTDAFARGAGTSIQFTIDQAYVDGISITHGSPRNHIWSYAAGANEVQQRGPDCSPNTCPCSGGPDSPPYVGNRYYCESAYQGSSCFIVNTFLPNDPIWDDQQCNNEGTCCTGTNTPPWFSVDLGNPTSDDIEVRICHNQDTSDEDSPVEFIELYIQ